ncbi:hypothetical protein FJTKL_07863 [Diaporthe vaccinii]|uniref:Uncharacterized protein n=1 Tax=Diaporthe vaccinii TaxID=105482 RepID=A0ABR4FDM9_9PEZI
MLVCYDCFAGSIGSSVVLAPRPGIVLAYKREKRYPDKFEDAQPPDQTKPNRSHNHHIVEVNQIKIIHQFHPTLGSNRHRTLHPPERISRHQLGEDAFERRLKHY